MTDERFGRLLDRAVPDIPEGLHTPPLRAIRRRARRRRAVITTAVAGAAALALFAAYAVTLPVRRDPAPPGPATTATASQPDPATDPMTAGPTIAADPGVVSWAFARISRDDRVITVFAVPAAGACVDLTDTHATFTAAPDRIVVTVRGTTRPAADCSYSENAVPIDLTLPDRLGTRPVIDAATGRPAPVYPDSVLPQAPGWHEPDTSYRRPTGNTLTVTYTRAGGPDFAFKVSPADGPAPSADAAERVELGARPGYLTDIGGMWTLRWRNGGFDITMQIVPNESIASMTRAEAVAALDQLDWPA